MLHAIRCKWHNGPHPIGLDETERLVLIDDAYRPRADLPWHNSVYLRTFFLYWKGRLHVSLGVSHNFINLNALQFFLSASGTGDGRADMQLLATMGSPVSIKTSLGITVHFFA